MAYMDWVLSDYLNMVAKQGFVDSKGIDSVSEVTRSSYCALGFHHDGHTLGHTSIVTEWGSLSHVG